MFRHHFFQSQSFKMTIYEVKRYGVTLEWTDSFRDAEDAFKEAGTGGCKLYRIVGSKKILLRAK